MIAALLALASSLSWGSRTSSAASRAGASRCSPCSPLAGRRAPPARGGAGRRRAHGARHDGDAARRGQRCSACWRLAAFYHALTIGTMSIVAPVSATGTAIPVLVGLFSGEQPSAVQVAGILLAGAGVVLAARAAPSADADGRRVETQGDRPGALRRDRLRHVLRGDRPGGAVRRRRVGAALRARPPTSRCCSSPARSAPAAPAARRARGDRRDRRARPAGEPAVRASRQARAAQRGRRARLALPGGDGDPRARRARRAALARTGAGRPHNLAGVVALAAG